MSDFPEMFEDDLNADILAAVSEQVQLIWPDWAPDYPTVMAVVEEGFVEEGSGESQASRDVLTIELASSALPEGATRQQLKTSLKVKLLERTGTPTVHVNDRRPLGAGAVQLIAVAR